MSKRINPYEGEVVDHITSQEVIVFLNYVLSGSSRPLVPRPREVNLLESALRQHGLDRPILTPSVIRHRWLLGPLDAVSKIFFPQGSLQGKLRIAAAVLECSPLSAEWLLPHRRPFWRSALLLVFVGLRALCKFSTGFILLVAAPKFVRANVQ